ncbi:MAG: MinD/ParA family protein [Tissierellaceae bacterium]|nr:MinD/ParA family protein [Tissierellaceae bacterium]
MIDQAAKLRELMKTKNDNYEIDLKNENMAKVISVSSGKGGVGKTNFALNFAISLKRLGYDIVIIDSDIGLSNVEILSGVSLNYSMSDIVFSNKSIFEIMGEGPEGVKIISGGSGLKELNLLRDENFPRLIYEIEKLQSSYDFIVIDTGAGISNAVIDFIMTSNEVIIISTPDPTSLMDSYTLIKSIVSNGFTGQINIVSNLVNNRHEGKEVFDKLSTTVNNFLRVQIKYFGYIEKDRIVSNAIRNQVPFIISHPNSNTAKKINIMAMNFLDKKLTTFENEKVGFAKKIFDIFSRRGG